MKGATIMASSPLPRTGDVIHVAAGACREYRAAFRLRVDKITDDRITQPILGGTVVNADGSDRVGRSGGPVERTVTVTDRDAVTVTVPAPATDAEIFAAAVEHVDRTRCDHVPGNLGCTHPHCPGVPPVDGPTTVEPIASDVPTRAEYGTQTWARDLRDALRAHSTITDVAMPRVSCAEGALTVRRYMVTSAQVGGHTVHVIDWESAYHKSVTAVMVDGELIDADVTSGRAVTSGERARMVAWRIADTLRDMPPVVATGDASAEPEPVAQVDADAPDMVAELLTSVGTTPAESEPEPAAQVEPVRLSATVERDALTDALTLAVWSIPRRPSVPVLAGVMLTAQGDALTVESFDYEVSSRTALAADVAADGRALVDAKAFRDMVRRFPRVKRPTPAQVRKGATPPAGAGRVRLTCTGDALTVEYGPVRLTLPTMPAEDYPTMPKPCAPVAQVDARTLAETVARIDVAAGRDDTLPNLTAVSVTIDADGRALLAATDRYRLALDTLPWAPVVPDGTDPREAIPPALIPSATLAHAAKVFGKLGAVVTVGYTLTTGCIGKTPATVAGAVSLTAGPVTITTRTIDGQFPAVRSLLPDAYAATAQVDAHALADTVARVGMVAERSMPVRLTWAPDGVTVAVGGEGSATASETVACKSDAVDGFTIAFNHAYLIDGLRAFAAGTAVRFGFTDARKSAVIESTDTDAPAYRYLIMPVRIGDGTASASAAPEAPASATDAPATDTTKETATVTAAEPADAPAQIDAPPTAEPVAGELHEPTERTAHEAYEAMTAGRFADARDALVDVRAVAPVGYRVAGRFTVEDLAEMIDAAERAADSSPVGPGAETVPVVEPVAAVDTDTEADTEARVRDLLSRAQWSTAVVQVGKGRERKPAGFDVLTLPDGRLPRPVYTAVADVVRGLGGAWNKEVKGFIFFPPRTVWDGTASGTRTASGADMLAVWLTRTASAPARQVAQVDAEPITPNNIGEPCDTPDPDAGRTAVTVSATPAPVDQVDADTVVHHADSREYARTLSAHVRPVVAADVPAGPLAFTLAPYTPEVGMSYRASRRAACAALSAAGVRASVVKSDADRRGFTVECAAADRARVLGIVAGAVALDRELAAV
jgi:DNA polymerase-3 subunit beta